MLGALLFHPNTLRYAKFAAGLRGNDVRDLEKYGFPVWAVVVASMVVGGYLAVRFSPEPVVDWVRKKKREA